MEFVEDDVREWHVTGVTTDGKRFKRVYKTQFTALCINLWRGSVWAVDRNGKRKLIKRVWN